MKRQALYFRAPYQVSIEEELLADPGAGEVLVSSRISAISAGTELLFYRGLAPVGTAIDETIPALAGRVEYPLKYGYALVGEVTALGAGVPGEWLGQLVFSFHPHESHFLARLDELIPVPSGLSATEAAFLPNMETAVTLVHDGQPLLGEQVAVLGQGVVGLLTTALLAQLPLASLVTLDRYMTRREQGLTMGAHVSLDATPPEVAAVARAALQGARPYMGADLTFELSGDPAALDCAIAVTGYSGRIIIGSWYGQKQASLDLGGRFHRSRLHLLASQVSHIAPELSGRWTSARRLDVAWRMLERIDVAGLVSHRFPLARAAAAYALLDQQPGEALQVLLTYPPHPG